MTVYGGNPSDLYANHWFRGSPIPISEITFLVLVIFHIDHGCQDVRSPKSTGDQGTWPDVTEAVLSWAVLVFEASQLGPWRDLGPPVGPWSLNASLPCVVRNMCWLPKKGKGCGSWSDAMKRRLVFWLDWWQKGV